MGSAGAAVSASVASSAQSNGSPAHWQKVALGNVHRPLMHCPGEKQLNAPGAAVVQLCPSFEGDTQLPNIWPIGIEQSAAREQSAKVEPS